eukprot:3570589-Rhodomonas_salina.2
MKSEPTRSPGSARTCPGQLEVNCRHSQKGIPRSSTISINSVLSLIRIKMSGGQRDDGELPWYKSTLTASHVKSRPKHSTRSQAVTTGPVRFP